MECHFKNYQLKIKKMCEQGILVEISTGPFDPQKKFSLRS